MNLEDSSISGTFLAGVREWFESLTRGDKFIWEEAVGPMNLVPQSLRSVSARDFIKAFSVKELPSGGHNLMLGTERLPSLPKEALAEEYGARQNLLSCLNVTLAVESLLVQLGKQASVAPALAGLLKLSLQPLWSSFGFFCRKKLELRRKALRGCNHEIRLVQRLLGSNPLTEDIFEQEVVDSVLVQAEHQAKPILDLLGYKYVPRKRSGSRQRGRTPKRARGPQTTRGAGGQHKSQQQQSLQQQNPQQQHQHQQGFSQRQFWWHRGQNYTPQRRGRGWYGSRGQSPRGRGSRSPCTPGRSPSSQGRGKSF